MAKRSDIRSILVIGSGPIVIGQACEFDYSGTQAVRALRREGYRVILVNSNPATIMTDPELADATYVEPLTPEFLERILEKERPDAILPTVGGQTALNLALALAERGILERRNVQLIGANETSMRLAEDRDLFKKAMLEIGAEVPLSGRARSLEEAERIREEIGLPLVIRPSFTLGGSGGGAAKTAEEFRRIVQNGLSESPVKEVLIEESVEGWKEFELEVMRDNADNVIIVCSIENFDAMGVHTGDSITVAPQMTLSDRQYQAMRDEAKAVIRKVGVDTGGSNIQFAVDPQTGRRVVIEMNPRVSRSSALASKATGFPIAKIAALLAVGYHLDEIPNDITQKTPASFEPSLDYVVVKIPRWTFEKFPRADARLTIQMKSVGEAMAIGRTFAEALGKAVRSLEIGRDGLDDGRGALPPDELRRKLEEPTAERLFHLRRAFRAGLDVDAVAALTRIDPWFLDGVRRMVEAEDAFEGLELDAIPRETLRAAKRLGLSDRALARRLNVGEDAIRERRRALGVVPVFKTIDTCAAEFEAQTPYFYSTYEDENESVRTEKPKVVILGGGPNRIGQGIEFDYCCVHACFALSEAGFETIMINCNPETVSTDYDTSDRLYFEPLTLEDVAAVLDHERPDGILVQFGGQTPLKLARALEKAGYPIWGTSPDSIDLAEDRGRFGRLLDELGLAAPPHAEATTAAEALEAAPADRLPARRAAVVRARRPRDGGRVRGEPARGLRAAKPWRAPASTRSSSTASWTTRWSSTSTRSATAPTPGSAGSSSTSRRRASTPGTPSRCCRRGRSRPRCSPRSAWRRAGWPRRSRSRGLMNIQFAIKHGKLYVLEVNPRASRTVPFVSKAIGVPLARAAALMAAGRSLSSLGFPPSAIRPTSSSRRRCSRSASSPARTPARTGDEVDGRGHGHLAAVRRRVRQGLRGRRDAPAALGPGVSDGQSVRQGGGDPDRAGAGGFGVRPLRHGGHARGAARGRRPGGARVQGQRRPAQRGRPHGGGGDPARHQHAARQGLAVRRGRHPRGGASALDPVPDHVVRRDRRGRGHPGAPGGRHRGLLAPGVSPGMNEEPAQRPGGGVRLALLLAAVSGFLAVFSVGFPPAARDRLPLLVLALALALLSAWSPGRGLAVFAFLFPLAAAGARVFAGSDAIPWPILLFAGFAAGWTFRFLYDFESVADPSPVDSVLRTLTAVWAIGAALAVVTARTLWAFLRGLSLRAVNIQGLLDHAAIRESVLGLAALASGAGFFFILRRAGPGGRERAVRGVLSGVAVSAALALLQRVRLAPPENGYWKMTGRLSGGAVDPNALGMLCGMAAVVALGRMFSDASSPASPASEAERRGSGGPAEAEAPRAKPSAAAAEIVVSGGSSRRRCARPGWLCRARAAASSSPGSASPFCSSPPAGSGAASPCSPRGSPSWRSWPWRRCAARPEAPARGCRSSSTPASRRNIARRRGRSSGTAPCACSDDIPSRAPAWARSPGSCPTSSPRRAARCRFGTIPETHISRRSPRPGRSASC